MSLLLACSQGAAAAPSTTVYMEEDFTLTTTGNPGGGNEAVDESGAGPVGGNTSLFPYEGDGSGIHCNSTSDNIRIMWGTLDRHDVQVTLNMVLDRGALTDRWQGMILRNSNLSTTNSEGLWLSFNGGSSTPNLILQDGHSSGTLLKTWDLSALTTPPATDDSVVLVMRCDGDDIILYSIQVNGGSVEVVDEAYTLTGGAATAHGGAADATRYGITSLERAAGSTNERFEYFKIESIPA